MIEISSRELPSIDDELAKEEEYDSLDEMRVAERERLAQALHGFRALHCFPSDANFLLARYEGSVPQLCNALLKRQIAVRQFPHGDSRLRSCIRITIGTPEENQRLLEALGDIIG